MTMARFKRVFDSAYMSGKGYRWVGTMKEKAFIEFDNHNSVDRFNVPKKPRKGEVPQVSAKAFLKDAKALGEPVSDRRLQPLLKPHLKNQKTKPKNIPYDQLMKQSKQRTTKALKKAGKGKKSDGPVKANNPMAGRFFVDLKDKHVISKIEPWYNDTFPAELCFETFEEAREAVSIIVAAKTLEVNRDKILAMAKFDAELRELESILPRIDKRRAEALDEDLD